MNILYGTTDLQFHMKRLMELKASISHGIFLPLFSFNYFHGSAVMSMYPFIGLYPLIFLSYFVSIVHSYYWYCSLIIFITLCISFYSSLNFSKSLYISYFFSIVYSISSTFMVEAFSTGDIGILESSAFLPLIIFGFIDIFNGHENDYLKLSLGLIFMSYCQLPEVIISILFIGIWTCINIKSFDKRKVITYIKMILLFILMTSIIWIPILNILLFKNSDKSVSMSQTITSFNTINFFKSLNLFAILGIILPLICFKKFNKFQRQMYLLSIFIILISSKLMPWKSFTSFRLFSFINVFQYTMRFLVLPELLLCYLCAVSVFLIVRSYKFKTMLIIGTTLFSVFMILLCQFYIINRGKNYKLLNSEERVRTSQNYIKDYKLSNNNDFKYLINGPFKNDDYFPKSSMTKLKYIYNDIGYDKCRDVKLKHNGFNKFSFKSKRKINKFNLPILLYKGENLHVLVDGRLVHFSRKNNLISIYNISKGFHNIKIHYYGNIVLRIIKYLLLVIGILWIILIYYKRAIKKRYSTKC